MVKVRENVPASDVLNNAKHILFVEGTPTGLDVTVLRELVPRVRVEPLGPSLSVQSVATALHPFHPDYWFIVDRDDLADSVVELSWQRFPNPDENNLLIWRRKELESYFLEPAWVRSSKYWNKPSDDESVLIAWLEQEATAVLWFEAAKRVVLSKRNAVKRLDAPLFKLGEIRGLSRDDVIQRLIESPAIHALRSLQSVGLEDTQLRAAFGDEVQVLSDGVTPLKIGKGRWRELIGAKALFSQMINQFYLVPDLANPAGPPLSGRDAERAVAVDLLRNHSEFMPHDFAELSKFLTDHAK